ncbi:MAG: class I lanthipeptide [Bacteroidales bacterium]|nr:class I lanthipeptide [Bacteroidales bacterium]
MKKLSLNKKIVSNLNSQDMNDVKGGVATIFKIVKEVVIWGFEHWVETKDRCLTDGVCMPSDKTWTCAADCTTDCPPC